MAGVGEWDKDPGDTIFSADINTVLRVVAFEESDTQVTGTTSETDVTSVITIPADTIINGLLVVANHQHQINGTWNSVLKVKADTSTPPTTIQRSQNITSVDLLPHTQRGMVIAIITGLTKTSANYVKITIQNTTVGADVTLNNILVFAY